MFIMSKLITSNILSDLSSDIVHKRVPLKLSLMSTMGAINKKKGKLLGYNILKPDLNDGLKS